MNLLEKQEVRETLEKAYGFTLWAWKDSLGGLSSQNFRFCTGQGEYVCKVYGPWGVRTRLLAQQVAEHMARCGVPVALPVMSPKGHVYHRVSKVTVAVFPYIRGFVLHEDTLDIRAHEQSALSLAKIHTAGEGYSGKLASIRKRVLSKKLFLYEVEKLKQKFSHVLGQSECVETREVLQASMRIKYEILQRFANRALSALDRSPTLQHGDYHNENVLFTGENKVLAVLDWEDACAGHGACDAMVWVQFACLNTGLTEQAVAKARHFLSAYRDVLPTERSTWQLALQRFFVELASSLFFEERTLSHILGVDRPSQERFCREVSRDMVKLERFLADPLIYAEALF